MKTLFKNWKNILLIGLTLTVVCFVFLYSKERDQRIIAERKSQEASKRIEAIVKPEIVYRDAKGRQHTVINPEANSFIKSEAKKAVAQLRPLFDTISKAINIKPKQIENVSVISTTTSATQLKAMQRTIDSLRRVTYRYQDNYLKLAYRPADPADTSDKGSFDFNYNADISVVQYSKRSFFLAAKKSYLDIYSNDPRTTINGVQRYSVIQREPAYGLRLQGLGNYNFSSGSITPGLALRFDISRFSVRGASFYSFDTNRKFYTLETTYDIFRLQ